ncbi:MAG TPA: DUF5819 family protein [Ruania sp.]|nr:DUF5819 family protein [Ruania sp.]
MTTSEQLGAAGSAESPPEKPPEHSKLTTLKRVVVLLLVFFTAWHIFATFLWIAPSSGLRQVVPGTLLHDYMIPVQGQSWSVFAPNPINGDYRIQVRAVVEEDGTEIETEWVDATEAELSMHTHNLFPPRASTSAIQVASNFKSAYDALDDKQQDVLALGYYEGDDWRQRMKTALLAHGNESAVIDFMDTSRVTNAYATQVAYAMWGKNVQQVQYIVSRQNVIPFEERNDPEAERPEVQSAPTGWRATITEPGQSQQRFAEIFLAGVEASGQ